MRTSLLTSLLLSSVFASTSCSKDTVLAIAVSNIPADAKTLYISAAYTSSDQNANPINLKTPHINLNGKTSTFISIQLPSNITSGLIDITLKTTQIDHSNDTIDSKPISIKGATTQPECETATWNGSIGITESGLYQLSANLNKSANKKIDSDLFGIQAISKNDIWAAGTSATVAHWDGCFWTNEQVKIAKTDGATPTAVTNGLSTIYYHPKTGLWAAGNGGLIIKYNEATEKWDYITKTVNKSLFGNNATGTPESPIEEIQWLDMSYIEGTTSDLLFLGSGAGTYCYTMRKITQGDKDIFQREPNLCSKQASAFSPTELPANPAIDNTYTYSPYQILSLASGLYTSGQIRKPQAPRAFSAFAFHADTKTFQNPIIKYITTNPNLAETEPNNKTEDYGPALSIWASSPDSIWLGGAKLFKLRPDKSVEWTNLNYTAQQSATYILYSIFGTKSDDFWVIGIKNRISQTSHITNPTLIKEKSEAGIDNFTITNVHGVASDDIWFTSYGGALIHYNGSSFEVIK